MFYKFIWTFRMNIYKCEMKSSGRTGQYIDSRPTCHGVGVAHRYTTLKRDYKTSVKSATSIILVKRTAQGCQRDRLALAHVWTCGLPSSTRLYIILFMNLPLKTNDDNIARACLIRSSQQLTISKTFNGFNLTVNE